MERYAPTIKDLAPRDMVSRVDAARGARGPRRRPEQGLRLPRPHPPRRKGRSRRSCPTSPSSRAPTSASSRSPSPCRCSRRRTTRWAASRPTSTPRCCATTTTSSPASTPPASARACPCTAPTASAPTRCSTSTCSASAGPARRRRVRADRRARRPARGSAGATRSSTWSSELRSSTGAERVAVLRKEHAGDDGPQRAGLPHRGDARSRPSSDIAGAASARYQNVSHPGQGQALQHRPARGDGARASCSTSPRLVSSARSSARRAAAATSARTTPTRDDDELHAAHHGLPPRRAPMAATTSSSTGSRSSITHYQPMERKY